MMKCTEVWAGGSCSGNPGPGGWAAIIRKLGNELVIMGKKSHTTNNEMELLATINAMELIELGESAIVYSDSKYVVDGMTKWVNGWINRGWVTATKQPVKNADLWKRLLKLDGVRDIKYMWIKGHTTTEIHYVNNLAKDQSKSFVESKEL
jgi:ribonuclease HI